MKRAPITDIGKMGSNTERAYLHTLIKTFIQDLGNSETKRVLELIYSSVRA
jgi:hypothetical protein